MADNTDPTTAATGEQVEQGATADIATGNLPLGVHPGTASYARETCEKDDCVVKNPLVMEDYRKAVEKKKKKKSERDAAGSGHQAGGGHQEGSGDGKDESKATGTP